MTDVRKPDSLRERLTLSQELTSVLQDRVVRGVYSPGTRIPEDLIATEFRISRGPVREALRQLEKDGLIVVEPYKGAIVLQISASDLENILLPVRYVLERFALEKAMQVMGPEEIAALQDVTDQMRAVMNEGGNEVRQKLVDLDVKFHATIFELVSDYHTRQLWSAIEPRIRAGFYQLGLLHERPETIIEEHEELLTAIRSGNVPTALELFYDHGLASPIRLLCTAGTKIGEFDE